VFLASEGRRRRAIMPAKQQITLIPNGEECVREKERAKGRI
jgi:hypothetical protein